MNLVFVRYFDEMYVVSPLVESGLRGDMAVFEWWRAALRWRLTKQGAPSGDGGVAGAEN